MKILVTGANGFIGKNLAKALEFEYEVVRLTKDIVDLTDRESVDSFFKDKYFDIVLHCAMVGGRRNIKDGPEVLYNNLAMFDMGNIRFPKYIKNKNKTNIKLLQKDDNILKNVLEEDGFFFPKTKLDIKNV